MVLLGFQFVITLTVALLLQKLSPFYSFARWIMCSNLYRYLHPSNEQLKAMAGKPAHNNKQGKKRNKQTDNNQTDHQIETFTIPCNLDITLECTKVEEVDLYSQYKYQDFRWLIDFAVCAVVVYVLIELVGIWRPQIYTSEFNIGLVWCCMVAFFALKELTMLTAAYWRSDDSGERSMTVAFGFFFFIMAMGILLIDERFLDFKLEKGYEHFSANLENVYEKFNFNVKTAPSIWSIKIVLALVSAFVGAVIGFPGIRYANMHLDALFFQQYNPVMKFMLHLTFFSPIPMCLLWILPLSKDLFVIKTKDNKPTKLISDENFLYLRIHLFILICLVRLVTSRQLLQAHLNTATQKIAKFKKETGRITNIELQRTVARVFYYLSAAALQYVAPIILMLFFGMMMRTLTYNMSDVTPQSNIFFASNSTENQQRKEYAQLIRSLFSVKLFNAVCSYLAWWTLASYFFTSCFGMVYLKFLS